MLIAREQSVLHFETWIARKNVFVDSQLAALRRSSVSYLFTVHTQYWIVSRICISTNLFPPASVKCHERLSFSKSFICSCTVGQYPKKRGGGVLLHFSSCFKCQKACKDCAAGNVFTLILCSWSGKFAFTFPYGVIRGSFALLYCCKYVFQHWNSFQLRLRWHTINAQFHKVCIFLLLRHCHHQGSCTKISLKLTRNTRLFWCQ